MSSQEIRQAFLDKAVNRVTEALETAREIDHPYSIAYALYHNGFLDLSRGRFDECLATAHELATVASENDYVLWSTLSTVLEGVSLTALGRAEEGLVMTEVAIDLYQGLTTPPVFWPLVLGLRALVHALAGRPEQALAFIDEAGLAERPGDITSTELWVFRGDFLRMLPEPDLDAAEEAYRTGIRAARAVGLHLVELKALTRLVDLNRSLGRTPDGRDELAAVYATFTEGFDEHDLVAARGVLG